MEMPWSELSSLQWLGLISGFLGAAVFIWLIVTVGQLDRVASDAVLSAARERDRVKAAEDARYLAAAIRSTHAAIALAGVFFAVLLAVFLSETTYR